MLLVVPCFEVGLIFQEREADAGARDLIYKTFHREAEQLLPINAAGSQDFGSKAVQRYRFLKLFRGSGTKPAQFPPPALYAV